MCIDTVNIILFLWLFFFRDSCARPLQELTSALFWNSRGPWADSKLLWTSAVWETVCPMVAVSVCFPTSATAMPHSPTPFCLISAELCFPEIVLFRAKAQSVFLPASLVSRSVGSSQMAPEWNTREHVVWPRKPTWSFLTLPVFV
jgi:hypothetical protein